MNKIKRVLSIMLIVSILTLSFNVIAFANTTPEAVGSEVFDVEKEAYAKTAEDSTPANRVFVDGGTKDFLVNGKVVITIPAGETVNYVSILLTNVSNPSDRSSTYRVVGPGGFTANLRVDGKVHYFNLPRTYSGGSSLTFEFYLDTNAPDTEWFRAGISLFRKI